MRMNSLRSILKRLASITRRRSSNDAIDDELRFHIEQRTSENIAAGMTAEEAAREARKRFGNMQNVREECRAASGIAWIDRIAQDLRFGFRLWRKQPGSFILAVAALTLWNRAGYVFALRGQLRLFRMVAAAGFRPAGLHDYPGAGHPRISRATELFRGAFGFWFGFGKFQGYQHAVAPPGRIHQREFSRCRSRHSLDGKGFSSKRRPAGSRAGRDDRLRSMAGGIPRQVVGDRFCHPAGRTSANNRRDHAGRIQISN